MFMRNYWYVAAWWDEVGRDLSPRTILDENMVLFRKQDGTPVALEDRCAHRRLPLSAGRLNGDAVECGYHGLVYDCTGSCIKVPGQRRTPALGSEAIRSWNATVSFMSGWAIRRKPTNSRSCHFLG